jgi:hypothetical protein
MGLFSFCAKLEISCCQLLPRQAQLQLRRSPLTHVSVARTGITRRRGRATEALVLGGARVEGDRGETRRHGVFAYYYGSRG